MPSDSAGFLVGAERRRKFEAIEAARRARDPRDLTAAAVREEPEYIPTNPSYKRTDFAVGRQYNDGKFVPIKYGMHRDVAESVAGRMRDAASDEEVAKMLSESWTFGHRAMGGNLDPRRRTFVPRAMTKQQRIEKGRKAAAARWNKPGFAGMTPEKRAEVSARANAARKAKLTPERRSEIAALANAARYGR
jgi:hypothetical protein